MNEKADAVGHAIEDAVNAWNAGEGCDDLVLWDADYRQALGRAAIEAMRDVECLPMLLAGKNALFSCSEDPTIEAAHDCFRAMLAVALTDKQP